MLTTIIILAVLNLTLTFLALSATGSVLQQLWRDADAFVQAHNALVRKLDELTETNSSALDCLISEDAALQILNREYLQLTTPPESADRHRG